MTTWKTAVPKRLRRTNIITWFLLSLVLASALLPFTDYLRTHTWQNLALTLVLMMLGATVAYLGFLAPKLLSYGLNSQSLVIHGPFGARVVPYEAVAEAASLAPPQLVRTFGASLPALQYGWFYAEGLGNVTIYGSGFGTEVVLVKLRGGEQLVLTPEQHEAFVGELRRHLSAL